jgi:hypothetical protein
MNPYQSSRLKNHYENHSDGNHLGYEGEPVLGPGTTRGSDHFPGRRGLGKAQFAALAKSNHLDKTLRFADKSGRPVSNGSEQSIETTETRKRTSFHSA